MTEYEANGSAIEHWVALLVKECKRIADEHGFTDATAAEDIALMHSELSEALEDIRAGKPLNEMQYKDPFSDAVLDYQRPLGTLGKPIGVPSELADVVIRVMHFCGKHGINLGKAILEKMAYNESRPFKHGGKAL